jgi:hypothetical protein
MPLLLDHPHIKHVSVETASDYMGLAMPLHLASSVGNLTLLTTVTSFNTPVDVTIAELRLEAFLPADADTAGRLESWGEMRRSEPPEAVAGPQRTS